MGSFSDSGAVDVVETASDGLMNNVRIVGTVFPAPADAEALMKTFQKIVLQQPRSARMDAIPRALLSHRVQATSGDFFKDPLPKADVITIGDDIA